MKKTNLVISILLLVIILSGAYYFIRTNNVGFQTDKSLPTFEQYKVGDIFQGTPSEPNFESRPEAKTFITRISEGAKEGPNFAGHYTVVSWGCGTSCQSSAVLDAKTGDIVVYGILSVYGLSYELNSSLLVVNPRENIPDLLLKDLEYYSGEHYPLGSTPGGADYYVLENNELKYLDRYSFVNNEASICVQVISPARNPVTDEIREFASPCKIPFGWEALETREGEM